MAHRARSDERAGHGGMGDREGHRHVGRRQARFFGERDELLDGVQSAFVAEGGEEAGADDVGLESFADAGR